MRAGAADRGLDLGPDLGLGGEPPTGKATRLPGWSSTGRVSEPPLSVVHREPSISLAWALQEPCIRDCAVHKYGG